MRWLERLSCWWNGCRDAEYYGECSRCGAEAYSPEYREHPALIRRWFRDWIINCRSRLRGEECAHCGRRFWRPKFAPCCSKECERVYVPF